MLPIILPSILMAVAPFTSPVKVKPSPMMVEISCWLISCVSCFSFFLNMTISLELKSFLDLFFRHFYGLHNVNAGRCFCPWNQHFLFAHRFQFAGLHAPKFLRDGHIKFQNHWHVSA